MPLLGGDVEGVEVEAGADGGVLEVVEREEDADKLLAPGLGGHVQRGLPGVRLRGGERGQRAVQRLAEQVEVPEQRARRRPRRDVAAPPTSPGQNSRNDDQGDGDGKE